LFRCRTMQEAASERERAHVKAVVMSDGAVLKIRSVTELLAVFSGSEIVTRDILEAISGKLARVVGHERDLNLRVAIRDETSVGLTPLRLPMGGTKELVLPVAAFQMLSLAERETLSHHPQNSFSSLLNMRQCVAALALQRVLRRHVMERRAMRRRSVMAIVQEVQSTTGEAVAIAMKR
jgi:hypothetical protein